MPDDDDDDDDDKHRKGARQSRQASIKREKGVY